MTGTLTAYFTVTGSTKEGVVTNVYGPQTAQEKESFTQTLQNVKSLLHMPH
jgi:hypothetical protein